MIIANIFFIFFSIFVVRFAVPFFFFFSPNGHAVAPFLAASYVIFW